MQNLPKSWVETTIENLCLIGDGNHSGKYPRKEEILDEGVPFIRGVDFDKGTIIRDKLQYISPEKHEQLKKGHLKTGDILFANRGMIGKTAILPEGFVPANLNSQLAWLRGYDSIQSKALYYQLQSLSVEAQLMKLTTGTALKQLPIGNLKKIELLVPPLPEQQRIVAKLDDLFGHLEQVKTRLEKIPDLLKNFRQAILTQAVTGKLTEEWREGKELDDIKDYITSLKTLKENKIEKRDNKTPVYESLEIYDIPKSWKWVRLWDISYLVTSGSRGWSSYYSDEGAYFVRSAEINNNKLRLEEAIKVNLPEKIEGKRSLIEKGNILTTVTGANVGKCAKIENNIPEAYVSQSVALIKLVSEELTDYVHLSMLAPNAGGGMLKDMAYGLGRPVLSLPQIKSIMIPLASMEEQTEIVQRVESLFAKADAIEAKYNTLKAQIDSLPQAILAKAFKGELVEQLPTDGNAADLLKEIQKLKTETHSKGKKKKKKSIKA